MKWQVSARISGLTDSAIGNKTFLDVHVSVLEGTAVDAKRKWDEYSAQAETDCNEGVGISTAKHCRVEQLLQQWYVPIIDYSFLIIGACY